MIPLKGGRFIHKWDRVTGYIFLILLLMPSPIFQADFINDMEDIGQPVMYLGHKAFGKFLQNGYEQFGKSIKEFNIKLE